MKFGLDNKETAGLYDVYLLFWKARASVYVQWDETMPGLSSVINTMLCVIHLHANSSMTMHHCMFFSF